MLPRLKTWAHGSRHVFSTVTFCDRNIANKGEGTLIRLFMSGWPEPKIDI